MCSEISSYTYIINSICTTSNTLRVQVATITCIFMYQLAGGLLDPRLTSKMTKEILKLIERFHSMYYKTSETFQGSAQKQVVLCITELRFSKAGYSKPWFHTTC